MAFKQWRKDYEDLLGKPAGRHVEQETEQKLAHNSPGTFSKIL